MVISLAALLPRLLATIALPFAVIALHAQALPPGVQLGITSAELQAAVPGLERVQRPQRLAGGLTGTWRAGPANIAGLPFETVFFFAGGVLRRVECVAATQAQPDLGAAAFADIVAWGREAFGPETASSDPGSAYAAWAKGDTDVYAQFISDPRRAAVRLVYKARQLKDGNEL